LILLAASGRQEKDYGDKAIAFLERLFYIYIKVISMTTSVIREKLVNYLQVADEKKIKAIYTMVEDEINTIENDWDEDFINELEARRRSFIDGTAKTYTWEETKQAAIDRVASRKK